MKVVNTISLADFEASQAAANATGAQSGKTVQDQEKPCGCLGHGGKWTRLQSPAIERDFESILKLQKITRIMHMVLIVLVILFLYKNTFRS